MHEDFVPYELAVKLKEKGFKEKCLAYYDIDDNVGLLHNTQYGDEYSPYQYTDLLQSHNTDTTIVQPDDSENCCDAPTISQVLKWLREENNVFILIEPDLMSPSYELVFSVRVKFYIKGEEDEGFSTKYLTYRRKSYEQAAIAGIVYCLDNLI